MFPFKRLFQNNQDRPVTPSRLNVPEVNGGEIYKLLPEANRFHTPWFRPSYPRLLSQTVSRHRYIYSPARRRSSDAVGRSMGAVNLDLNLALRFNLTYTHRTADYSTLTMHDARAVEDFFGWDIGHLPREAVQRAGCHPPLSGTTKPIKQAWPPPSSNLYSCMPCGAPRKQFGALNIRKIIQIPWKLATKQCRQRSTCEDETKAFIGLHNESHTIFQAPYRECGAPDTDLDLLYTKNLFYHQYWKRHAQSTPWSPLSQGKDFSYNPLSLIFRIRKRKRRDLSPPPLSRPIRYREDELVIAIHSRRGDFLEESSNRSSDLTPDVAFAKAVQRVLLTIRKTGAPFSNLPRTSIHIYSEGKLSLSPNSTANSIHDTTAHDRKYYDEQGIAQNASWWQNLLFTKYGDQTAAYETMMVSFSTKLRVVMHVSDDTLLSAHEMASADVFIGSMSAYSVMMVWSLARGIVLVPTSNPQIAELKEKGTVCCTVPFDKTSGEFSVSLFTRFWKAYVRANGVTLEKVFNSLDSPLSK